MNNTTNANGANFDPYLTWLGIRDPQRPPNHYRLLGLELFESDSEVIAAAADRQMTYVRTYQAGQQGEHSQRILNELTTAKLCLLKPERKRDYDDRLRAAQKPAPLPPMQAAPAYLPQAPAFPPPVAHPMNPAAGARPAIMRPLQAAAPVNAFAENTRFGSPPVSARSAAARPPKNNAVMQWSIVGGLVLATIILVVILANRTPETPVAENNSKTPPAKVAPIATKTPANNPKTIPASVTNPVEKNPGTEPAPESPVAKTPVAAKAPKNPDEVRPGPVKNPLPNIPLPGIEEANNPPSNPAPMNPATAVNPSNPATPMSPAVAMTSSDPLNSLPTSPGNKPTEPPPAGTPATPAEPFNPLAMPNPLDPKPAPGEAPKPTAPRRPVPSAKEIAENRANVREVFKNEYTSRDAAALAALGKRLLKLAQESAEKPAMMYTTYDEARNVSAQVNDLETTFTAHDELAREFAVDRDKDLVETLKVVAKSAATMNAENAGSVLDLLNESVTAAILETRLDTAEQLLRFVGNFTGRVPDKAAREVGFRDLQKRLGEHKAFAPKAKEYKETLAKNPNDGDANLEMGKFWAFQQGNFEQGLSYLAKASDTEIRDAASRELSLKPDAPDFVKVADGWWEVANKLPTDPRSTVKIHAAYSYARVLPNLKALDRGLAESRINEAYKLFKPNNREVKELMKLLLTRGNWKMEWKGRTPNDATLGFNPSGAVTSYEYPNWKLLDNGYVVCYRDRSDRPGPPSPFSRFGGFGRGRGNDNNDNNNGPKPPDFTKNVMHVAVTANRIEVRVLGYDGELRGTGTGIPE